MLGVFVNVLSVLLGGGLGLLLKKGIPQKVEQGVLTALGLCCALIGIQGALDGMDTLTVIISMVLGTVVGGLLDIHSGVERLGAFVERKFRKESGTVSLAEGFVSATLLFCVGAMTVVGSLNSGLRGDHTMLYTKSLLDFFSGMMLAVSLGAGVLLSSVSVLVIQGGIALLAKFIEPLLSAVPGSVEQISCVGSVMILAIGLNLMGMGKLKVANYLPALVITPLVVWISNFVVTLL